MRSANRWLALGAAVLGVGALLVVSWLVYALQNHSTVSFWSWPGITGVLISTAGFVMLIVGFVMPGEDAPIQQIQRGGKRSANFQAGHDINLRDDRSGE